MKQCAYGTCDSDSKYSRMPHMRGVKFFRFPDQTVYPVSCLKWVNACGRVGFGVENVTKYTYVCSRHFHDEVGPTSQHPYPISNSQSRPTEITSLVPVAELQDQQLQKKNKEQKSTKTVRSSNRIHKDHVNKVDQDPGLLDRQVVLIPVKDLNAACLQKLHIVGDHDYALSAFLPKKLKDSEICESDRDENDNCDIDGNDICNISEEGEYVLEPGNVPEIEISQVPLEDTVWRDSVEVFCGVLPRLSAMGWFSSITKEELVCLRVEKGVTAVEVKVSMEDGTYFVSILGKPILEDSCPKLKNISLVRSVQELDAVLGILQRYALCPGISEPAYLEHFREHKVEYVAYCHLSNALRSPKCSSICTAPRIRCVGCRQAYRNLKHRVDRAAKDKKGKVYMNCLSQQDLKERCRKLLQAVSKEKKKVKRAKSAIQKLLEKNAEAEQAEAKREAELRASKPAHLFFWEQQQKLRDKASTARRWHPLIAKWCCDLYSKSPPAYRALLNSGFLHLPCVTTIHRLRRLSNQELPSFQECVATKIDQSSEQHNPSGCEQEKDMSLIIDEILEEQEQTDSDSQSLDNFQDPSELCEVVASPQT